MCRIVSWDSYLSINLVMKYQAFATMQESVSIDWRLSKFIAVITCQDMFPAIYPTALSPRCMHFLTSMSISKSSSNTNKAFTHSNLQ